MSARAVDLRRREHCTNGLLHTATGMARAHALARSRVCKGCAASAGSQCVRGVVRCRSRAGSTGCGRGSGRARAAHLLRHYGVCPPGPPHSARPNPNPLPPKSLNTLSGLALYTTYLPRPLSSFRLALCTGSPFLLSSFVCSVLCVVCVWPPRPCFLLNHV